MRNNHDEAIARRAGKRTTPAAPHARNIVSEHHAREVADHPFFRDLRAGPVDHQALWLLMANLRAGISRNFVVWLATTIAHVQDRRIGSLIAKQLDDELGHGDFAEIHSTLLDRFVEALSRWRWHGLAERALLAPGKKMGLEMGALFNAQHPYEAVGALIVGEIFAEKMDRCVGDEVRRQSALSSDEIRWLTVHEVLETDHAADSDALAILVPDSGPALAATWRGARSQWDLLWRFLDDVHSLAQECRAARAPGAAERAPVLIVSSASACR
jgi:pyrroloquinoline quinone (PQQ) biosynthesis protein C